VDTSEIPQPDTGPSTDGGDVRLLLDQAARAYMDGDYSAAVGSWREVLECDPANPRAREGIKKVSMLQAGDSSDEDVPFDPILEEVENLLKRRSFDAALELCHQHVEGAGPSLKIALRRLEQRAERARVVEPEILRCMADARRSLQAGKVSEALPHLKQALTLDRSHPVASRLMEGLRERARRRETTASKAAPPVAPDSEQAELIDEMDKATDLLPASGQPGSDAPSESLAAPENEPARLGHGLPSSPVGKGPDPSAPEIELDMISLDDALGDGGDEVIAQAPMEIQMEDGTGPGQEAAGADPLMNLDDTGRRSAAGGHSTESPFEGIEDGEPLPPEAASPVADAEAVADTEAMAAPAAAEPIADPVDKIAGESLADVLGTDDEEPGAKPIVPRAESSHRGGSARVRYAALAAVVLAGGLAVAWQFGLLSSPQTDFGPREVATGNTAAGLPAGEEPALTQAAGGDESATPDQAPGVTAAPEATSDARRALVLLEQGQDLYKAGRIPEASAVLAQAKALDPMNSEIAAWIGRSEQVTQAKSKGNAEHSSAVAAFNAKEFETALRKFYRLEEQDPGGPYGRYIENSWYNWGLQFLAAGNLREAGNKMNEVLTIRENDPDAQAIKKLVEDYARKAKDRTFYTQIEALHYRPLDA
jgi:tetratricopeptide (TPR) repeat protein